MRILQPKWSQKFRIYLGLVLVLGSKAKILKADTTLRSDPTQVTVATGRAIYFGTPIPNNEVIMIDQGAHLLPECQYRDQMFRVFRKDGVHDDCLICVCVEDSNGRKTRKCSTCNDCQHTGGNQPQPTGQPTQPGEVLIEDPTCAQHPTDTIFVHPQDPCLQCRCVQSRRETGVVLQCQPDQHCLHTERPPNTVPSFPPQNTVPSFPPQNTVPSFPPPNAGVCDQHPTGVVFDHPTDSCQYCQCQEVAHNPLMTPQFQLLCYVKTECDKKPMIPPDEKLHWLDPRCKMHPPNKHFVDPQNPCHVCVCTISRNYVVMECQFDEQRCPGQVTPTVAVLATSEISPEIIWLDPTCKHREPLQPFREQEDSCTICVCDLQFVYVHKICRRTIDCGLPEPKQDQLVWLDPECQYRKPNTPYMEPDDPCQVCACILYRNYIIKRCQRNEACNSKLPGPDPDSTVPSSHVAHVVDLECNTRPIREPFKSQQDECAICECVVRHDQVEKMCHRDPACEYRERKPPAPNVLRKDPVCELYPSGHKFHDPQETCMICVCENRHGEVEKICQRDPTCDVTERPGGLESPGPNVPTFKDAECRLHPPNQHYVEPMDPCNECVCHVVYNQVMKICQPILCEKVNLGKPHTTGILLIWLEPACKHHLPREPIYDTECEVHMCDVLYNIVFKIKYTTDACIRPIPGPGSGPTQIYPNPEVNYPPPTPPASVQAKDPICRLYPRGVVFKDPYTVCQICSCELQYGQVTKLCQHDPICGNSEPEPSPGPTVLANVWSPDRECEFHPPGQMFKDPRIPCTICECQIILGNVQKICKNDPACGPSVLSTPYPTPPVHVSNEDIEPPKPRPPPGPTTLPGFLPARPTGPTTLPEENCKLHRPGEWFKHPVESCKDCACFEQFGHVYTVCKTIPLCLIPGQQKKPSQLHWLEPMCKWYEPNVLFQHPEDQCELCSCMVVYDQVMAMCQRTSCSPTGVMVGHNPNISAILVWLEPTCKQHVPNTPYVDPINPCETCSCLIHYNVVFKMCRIIKTCTQPNTVLLIPGPTEIRVVEPHKSNICKSAVPGQVLQHPEDDFKTCVCEVGVLGLEAKCQLKASGFRPQLPGVADPQIEPICQSQPLHKKFQDPHDACNICVCVDIYKKVVKVCQKVGCLGESSPPGTEPETGAIIWTDPACQSRQLMDYFVDPADPCDWCFCSIRFDVITKTCERNPKCGTVLPSTEPTQPGIFEWKGKLSTKVMFTDPLCQNHSHGDILRHETNPCKVCMCQTRYNIVQRICRIDSSCVTNSPARPQSIEWLDPSCRGYPPNQAFQDPRDTCKACACLIVYNKVIKVCEAVKCNGIRPQTPNKPVEKLLIWLEPSCKSRVPGEPYTRAPCELCACVVHYNFVMTMCQNDPHCGTNQLVPTSPTYPEPIVDGAIYVTTPLPPPDRVNLIWLDPICKYHIPGKHFKAIGHKCELCVCIVRYNVVFKICRLDPECVPSRPGTLPKSQSPKHPQLHPNPPHLHPKPPHLRPQTANLHTIPAHLISTNTPGPGPEGITPPNSLLFLDDECKLHVAGSEFRDRTNNCLLCRCDISQGRFVIKKCHRDEMCPANPITKVEFVDPTCTDKPPYEPFQHPTEACCVCYCFLQFYFVGSSCRRLPECSNNQHIPNYVVKTEGIPIENLYGPRVTPLDQILFHPNPNKQQNSNYGLPILRLGEPEPNMSPNAHQIEDNPAEQHIFGQIPNKNYNPIYGSPIVVNAASTIPKIPHPYRNTEDPVLINVGPSQESDSRKHHYVDPQIVPTKFTLSQFEHIPPSPYEHSKTPESKMFSSNQPEFDGHYNPNYKSQNIDSPDDRTYPNNDPKRGRGLPRPTLQNMSPEFMLTPYRMSPTLYEIIEDPHLNQVGSRQDPHVFSPLNDYNLNGRYKPIPQISPQLMPTQQQIPTYPFENIAKPFNPNRELSGENPNDYAGSSSEPKENLQPEFEVIPYEISDDPQRHTGSHIIPNTSPNQNVFETDPLNHVSPNLHNIVQDTATGPNQDPYLSKPNEDYNLNEMSPYPHDNTGQPVLWPNQGPVKNYDPDQHSFNPDRRYDPNTMYPTLYDDMGNPVLRPKQDNLKSPDVHDDITHPVLSRNQDDNEVSKLHDRYDPNNGIIPKDISHSPIDFRQPQQISPNIYNYLGTTQSEPGGGLPLRNKPEEFTILPQNISPNHNNAPLNQDRFHFSPNHKKMYHSETNENMSPQLEGIYDKSIDSSMEQMADSNDDTAKRQLDANGDFDGYHDRVPIHQDLGRGLAVGTILHYQDEVCRGFALQQVFLHPQRLCFMCVCSIQQGLVQMQCSANPLCQSIQQLQLKPTMSSQVSAENRPTCHYEGDAFHWRCQSCSCKRAGNGDLYPLCQGVMCGVADDVSRMIRML